MTNKVIGIHKGAICNRERKVIYNIGTFLKFPLNDIGIGINNKKIIPIINTISTRKNLFLNGLLGTDLVENWDTNTTKFICLFINSEEIKFYHVIPKREKYLEFIKDGEEIKGEINIKNKIEEINWKLKDINPTINDIFYMLEIPIKYIDNYSLLEECCFMNIPNLEEKLYFDIIFSILTLEDIKFEIIIFDSINIGTNDMKNMIKKLEERKCLQKRGILFILDNLEKTNHNEEEITNSFCQFFQDDKKKNLITNNLNQNIYFPMNSILYSAEGKMSEDFYSILIVEFFYFFEYNKKLNVFNSFYDYLNKKVEFILHSRKNKENNNILNKMPINNEELKTIEKNVEKLNKLQKDFYFDCSIGIEMKKTSIKNNMINLFLLHKNKSIFPLHNKYHEKLNLLFNIIPTTNDKDTLSNEKKSEEKEKIHKLFSEFEVFLKDTELNEEFKSLSKNKNSFFGRN